MYPVTADVQNLFINNYRQTAEIRFCGINENLTITQEDIRVGGFSIDRYCTSNERIELGSAIAAELTLELDNSDGRFNDIKFEGAELFVRVGIKKWDARAWEKAAVQYIPCGYFTVDEPPRKLTSISISALDRMVLFDKDVNWELFKFPITAEALLAQVCSVCNVMLSMDTSALINHDYVILSCPAEEKITYRQIIQWIAEITASCAFIDWEGKLRLSWYKDTAVQITPSMRYSSDLHEDVITISGVQITDAESNIYLAGDDGYAFHIEQNGLIQNNYQEIAEAVYSVVGGFSYRPYECTCKPMPYIYPLDVIAYTDNKGSVFNTIVTNVNYTLNANTVLQGRGETKQVNSYAAANPLTKNESIIINSIKKAVNETLNSSLQTILGLNELITNSMGLYTTSIKNPDGSITYYMHDCPSLEQSTTIYTMVSGGFAYTNSGWNGGNPIWQYGFTKDGNAIYNKVCAYGIEVSNPNSKYHAKISPEAFETWFGEMRTATFNGEESQVDKLNIKTYSDCGKIRIAPHTENGVVTGANIIFLD